MDQCEDREEGVPPSKTTQRVDQQSSEGPRSQSAQQHQTQLDFIFMLLEDKIVAFVKKELKKIQKVLSSNHSQSLEKQMAEDDLDGEEDEQRSNREAFLKITIHFLRKMKLEELADRLQNMVPVGVQELVLIKEEAPEEQKPHVDQQDREHLHIKEEEEELWTSLQLGVKEETDPTSFSFTAGSLKHEDDEDKCLFLELHQHQVEVIDHPNSLGDNLKSATGKDFCGGVETTRNPDLSTHEDGSHSTETEDSEDGKEENDLNNPDSQLKDLADSGSKTEDIDKDWASSPSRVSEAGVKNNKNEQKLFNCELCDRRFSRKGELNIHMRIHTGQKPFCCEVCQHRFTIKGHLKRHMTIHTGEKPFCCELCGRRFTTKIYFKTHMRIHSGQKPYCCELCQRAFTEKGNLNKHMRIHTGEKPFCCELCDHKCTTKDGLNKHMKIHTGQKPFCCELCEQRFTIKSNLNKHIKLHIGQKPFYCELCDRRFSRNEHLNKHMRIHTGEKPFSCELCDRRFRLKEHLKKHMSIHTK